MKPLILSQTTSYLVTPLSVSADSYAIINGKEIDLSETPEYLLELNKLLVDDSHFAFVVILTENGIDFRTGITNSNYAQLDLPPINPLKEIVLAYYEISLRPTGDISTTIHPITLTTEYDEISNSFIPGWIPAFKAYDDPTALNKIVLDDTNLPQYMLNIIFKNAVNIISSDYIQNRTYYLYHYLIGRLQTGKTIILDQPSAVSPSGGTKQVIENYTITEDGHDIILTLEIANKDANISSLALLTYGYISIYFNDDELLLQEETQATTSPLPYMIENGGIFGQDSELYKKYYNNEINTGDRIFREIDKVQNIIRDVFLGIKLNTTLYI